MPAVLNGQAQDLANLTDALMGTAGIASFPAGAAPANNVSLAEVLRSVWGALMGTATGENGITTWPTGAAPGNTVSLAEGLRWISDWIGVVENTLGTATIGGVLGDVANVPIATRLTTLSKLGLPSSQGGNYLAVTADLTSATWNSDATHEVFTVTGTVRMAMWITCGGNVGSSGGTATVSFGTATDTDAFIAATDETELDDGDLWYDTTPTTSWDTFANVVMDYVVTNGIDVGYEIDTEALDAGSLTFHCVWWPLSATGNVAAGDGTALA